MSVDLRDHLDLYSAEREQARIDQVDVVSSFDGNFRVEIQIAINLDDGNLDYNIYFIEN